MIEIIATVAITVSSVLLFAYWFRYTCLLILSAKTTRDYACGVAAANQLSFLQVQSQLQVQGQEHSLDFDQLRRALDRDYEIVKYLLKHGTSLDGQSSLETQMLAINYRLMGAWFRVGRRFSSDFAACALEEMSLVVAHFANTMGERAACSSAA